MKAHPKLIRTFNTQFLKIQYHPEPLEILSVVRHLEPGHPGIIITDIIKASPNAIAYITAYITAYEEMLYEDN